MDLLLDLSKIKNISEMNRMRTDQDEIDVNQIEVDLDEDELAEMERIMRTKMNFANGAESSNSSSPPIGSGKLNI
jgi:phosphoenolpyruvate carboxylase